MVKTTKKLNQTGASAIVFTMVFMLVLSLLSVGFAALAQRDQKASLDKTLSSQAQLATEAGVNSVVKYIENGGLSSNDQCNPGATVSGYVMPNFNEPGFGVSCIKWELGPTEAQFSLAPFSSYSFNQKNHQGFTQVEWTTSNVQDTGAASLYADPGANKLPSIEGGKKSIIKIVTVINGDLYTVSPQPKVQVIYLVPYAGADVSPNTITPIPDNANYGTDYVDLGSNALGTQDARSADGLVYYVPCNSQKCSVMIAGYPTAVNNVASYGDRLFYFMPIGSQTTNITYRSLDGDHGTPLALNGIQAKVDVNVIAQGQSKRTIAYIPLQKQTWQPSFNSIADSLCKDIKVDGNNNQGKIDTATACPNN